MVMLGGGNIVGGDGRSLCWFSEIGGQTLLWDSRRTLLRRRPTEEADGVFLFVMVGRADGLMDE